jgi:ATP-binding cassette subfamily C (CFTR/MRP) protein 1
MLNIPQEKQGGLAAVELGADWPSKGEIEFKKVVLRYRPDTDIVLNQLTFACKPGEKIGVVGRTGAGKSTICLSLSRIVEIVAG